MIKTLSSRVVYENRWMVVREDDIERADGSKGIYGVADKPTAAIIIATDGKRVHLVEQYRYTMQRRCWELPQGACEDNATLAAVDIARRELREETGLDAKRMTKLQTLQIAYGFLRQPMHVFVAEDLVEGAPQRESTEQDMKNAWFNIDDVARMMIDGTIVDMCTIAAWHLFTTSRR